MAKASGVTCWSGQPVSFTLVKSQWFVIFLELLICEAENKLPLLVHPPQAPMGAEGGNLEPSEWRRVEQDFAFPWEKIQTWDRNGQAGSRFFFSKDGQVYRQSLSARLFRPGKPRLGSLMARTPGRPGGRLRRELKAECAVYVQPGPYQGTRVDFFPLSLLLWNRVCWVKNGQKLLQGFTGSGQVWKDLEPCG